MQRSGHADLPLHYGTVPRWLAERMALLGGAIVEAIVLEYGKAEVIKRLSDPAWFQSLGCVMGMDWHSSGITTSVMGALKSSINPISKELGIYICGGRGKHSRNTPNELMVIAGRTGLNGAELVRSSRLSAKVDNTAIQDGFQIYLHSFVLTDTGEWSVIQQGMNDATGYARRYHWHSSELKSFTEEPHTFVYGRNQGQILNLTHKDAATSKSGIIAISKENPDKMLAEIKKIKLPSHHDVQANDVDLKRLGAVLVLAQDLPTHDFENLLLLQGLGPRTLQSLTLVSEVIHGTPSRFSDPARFSFAHGGKDGHPFPVPTKVYDESIDVLRTSIEKARLGQSDKLKALNSLTMAAQALEKDFEPTGSFDDVIKQERENSWRFGGRTVKGKAKPPKGLRGGQLGLFE
ncbi:MULTISPECIES: DUF763 domain-containing protein [unclassified Imperialibacter]|uniref:DUF763 domain-containing protein n=1 Tax=unclassified Imperialibacter TaxID=2629706 RepID=UPI00125EC2D3|nr:MULTISPECIES: DUF763 domain-containing protein [unclassified Imperialibacter]